MGWKKLVKEKFFHKNRLCGNRWKILDFSNCWNGEIRIKLSTFFCEEIFKFFHTKIFQYSSLHNQKSKTGNLSLLWKVFQISTKRNDTWKRFNLFLHITIAEKGFLKEFLSNKWNVNMKWRRGELYKYNFSILLD